MKDDEKQLLQEKENKNVTEDGEELANDKQNENHFQENDEEPSNEEVGNVEEASVESLSEEVLDMIVNISMTGHNRTLVGTFNVLSHTNTRFKRLVSRYISRQPN